MEKPSEKKRENELSLDQLHIIKRADREWPSAGNDFHVVEYKNKKNQDKPMLLRRSVINENEKEKLKHKQLETEFREKLQSIGGSHVLVPLVGTFFSNSIECGTSKNYYCILTTDVDTHTLSQRLEEAKKKPLSESEILKIVSCLAEGLEFFEKAGIFHPYLLPNCIVLNGDGSVAIANIYSDSPGAKTEIGTLKYVPPEILKGEKFGTDAVAGIRGNVYSFGRILEQLLKSIREKSQQPKWSELITACTQHDPAKRFTPKQIRETISAIRTSHEELISARHSPPSLSSQTPGSVEAYDREVKFDKESKYDKDKKNVENQATKIPESSFVPLPSDSTPETQTDLPDRKKLQSTFFPSAQSTKERDTHPENSEVSQLSESSESESSPIVKNRQCLIL